MSLREYEAKRDFRQTPEPGPHPGRSGRRLSFVIQEHHAARLHYDFRLEAEGVLKSWAVTKQPSLDPAVKRLAVRVEDHPRGYARFEGTIPAGHYGAGTVSIWDLGTYELADDRDAARSVAEGLEAGRLVFELHGRKLRGRFALVRMKGKGRGKENWLLIKMKDEHARPEGTAGDGKASSPRPSRRKRTASQGKVVSAAERPPAAPELTHPDKVMYPDAGITKGEVFVYYRRIARRLLPYLRDRPVTLERLPEGLGGAQAAHFWQKNAPQYYPAWIARADLPTERGKRVPYVLVNDLPTLLYLVNQNTLTFHVWFSRVQDVDRPDFVLFDLDPGEAAFADAVAVARQLHETLEEEGERAFVKTSGKTGLHILTRWEREGGYDEARAWAAGVAARVVAALPDRATADIRKARRGGRVYIDVMQNARGHHAAPPYVLRAVPGAPVSTPLHWREVTEGLDPKKYNLQTIFRRLARQKADPMAGLLRTRARPGSGTNS